MKTPKTLKVIYNGDFLCNIYPHASWFQVMKYRLARGTRVALVQLFFTILILSSFTIGRNTTQPIYAKAEDTSSQRFNEKIEMLKDRVVAQLASCESAGYKESDGIIILDTNNKASIGQYQWQVKSVQHYVKLSTGVNITPKEAILLALDKEKAGELVKYVAFKTNNKLGKDWYNCTNKLDLDRQVEMIKLLEK